MWLAAWCWLVVPAWSAPPALTVLVLFPNAPLLPASLEIHRALRDTIAPSGGREVDVFTEFLDRPYFMGEAHEARFANFIREKYAERPPQVIVAVGPPPLQFALRYRETSFPAVPIVHVGIDREVLQGLSPLPPAVVGIPVDYEPARTVELALRLHPTARKIVVVTGTTPFDLKQEADIRAGLAQLRPAQPVEYLAGLPHGDVLRHLEGLGRDDIVVTPGYFKDGKAQEFIPRDSVVQMQAVSGAPIYAFFSSYFGTGIVGGRMPSFADMGSETGAIVTRVLEGAPLESIPVSNRIPSPTRLDWRQVRRWGVDESAIPPDAIIQFREPTFWETYRTRTIIAAAVIAIQAGLIAALLLQRRLRRSTALALAESEQRITLAAHAARLSMWIWDLAQGRVWTDQKLREHAGLSREVPERFDDVLQTVHPADRERFNRAVRDAAANHTELDVEYRVTGPGQEVRWFAARGHAAIGVPNCIAGVKMDITARKAAERQATADRAALTHLSRVSTMGQLSAAIAHQLNQPLAAILGNAETAAKMLRQDPIDVEEVRQILDDIVSEDHRAAEVIRRLGALYKRGEMEMVELDLNDLVRETLDLVRAELMLRQVGTSVDLNPFIPYVLGGRVQLQQVLLNLILNAADAMSGVEVEQRVISVSTSADGSNISMCVRDRGTGISPADLPRVFDPFWSTKTTGVGVGLAICHAIATAHRGTLTADNNSGIGATFCLKLPIRQSQPAA